MFTGCLLAAVPVDNFAEAPTNPVAGFFSTDLGTATAEPEEPAHAGTPASHSVWTRFIPPLDGQLRLTQTAGWRSLRIAAYTGDSLETLVPVSSSAFSEDQWTAGIEVEANVIYHLAVDDAGEAPGSVSLATDFATFYFARPTGSLVFTEPAEPVLQVVDSVLPETLEEVGIRDLASAEVLTTLVDPPYEFAPGPLAAGRYRYGATARYQGGVTANSPELTLTVRPANDAFEQATTIPGDVTGAEFTTQVGLASEDPGQPPSLQPRTVWWRWTPEFEGLVSVRQTAGADMGGLQAFIGDSLATLEPVPPDFHAQPGQTCHFAMSGSTADLDERVWTLSEETLQLLVTSHEPNDPGAPVPAFRTQTGTPIALRVTNSNPTEAMTNITLVVHSIAGGSTVATWDEPPYEATWTPEVAGFYEIHAVARFETGASRQTAAILFEVRWDNDLFEDASPVSPAAREFQFEVGLTGATAETGEPGYDGRAAKRSRWWRWEPDSEGQVVLAVVGEPDVNAVATVYQGESLTNLSVVARCSLWNSENTLTFRADAGAACYFSFDSTGGNEPADVVWEMQFFTLHIASPSPGAHLTLSTPNRIDIRNTDTNLTPVEVEFFVDGESQGAVAQAPFEWNWLPESGGWRTLTATARDGEGHESHSLPVTVWVGAPNDDLVSAEVIESGPPWRIEGDLAAASWEAFEGTSSPGGSLWYQWTPAVTHRYSLRLSGDALPNLTVYAGNPAEEEVVIFQAGHGHTRVTVPFEGGITYYLRVSGDPDRSFVIESFEPAPNDLWADAALLEGTSGSFGGANHSADLEPDEPFAWISGSLWWRWTAPATGDLSLSVSEETECHLVGAVFRGTELANLQLVCEPLTLLNRNNEAMIPTPRTLVTRVLEGVTYSVALGSGDVRSPTMGTILGEFSLNPVPNAPENDFYADRVRLTGTEVTLDGDLTGATREYGEPPVTKERTVWYEWTAPIDCAVTVSAATHGGWSGVLKLHTGDLEAGNLQTTAALRMPVRSGQSIQVSLGTPSLTSEAGGFTLQLTTEVLPPPPDNDDFATSATVPPEGIDTALDCASATLEPGEPDHAQGLGSMPEFQGSRWWTFTAPRSGRLQVFPTQLVAAVYRGESLESLQLIANGWLGPIEADLQADEVIHLAVVWDALGSSSALRTEFLAIPPDNDAFANATRIEGETPVEASGHLLGCTPEPDEPVHVIPPAPESLSGATAWWSWVAPVSGRASLVAASAEFLEDWTLVVYQGTEVGQLERVAQSLGSWNGYEIAFSAVAGQEYHIACEQRIDGSPFVAFNLDVVPWPEAPDNDDFAQARTPSEPRWQETASVQGATREPGEPSHGGSIPGKSLWWRWQAPYNANVEVFNSGIASPANLALYRGSSLTTLQRVGGAVDAARITLQGGETYSIAAEVPVEAAGDIRLGINTGFPSGQVIPTPGNLFLNGSFEELAGGAPGKYWYGSKGGVVDETGVDGRNYMIFGMNSEIWQDVATTVGVPYRLRFATAGEDSKGPVHIRVFANDTEILDLQYDSRTTFSTQWSEVVFTADSATTRIKLTSYDHDASLDAMSLVALNEPPEIVLSPVSRTVWEGSPVEFEAAAVGTDPMVYQWLHNGEPMSGTQAAFLYLPEVSAADAGTYLCVVTNGFGRAETTLATLTVETPGEPQILLHPEGGSVVPGGRHVLVVVAQGVPPLSYQWFKEGEPIADATEPRLVLDPYTEADDGTYHVRVSNADTAVRSLPATLRSTAPTPGGGTLMFANFLFQPEGGMREAPVYDVDGITPLWGAGFVAQLYVGADEAALRPVSQPSPFLESYSAGLWHFQRITLPHLAPGLLVATQVRAWDTAFGASYEEARARGGKHGHSAVIQILLEADSWPQMDGLESFHLTTGRPEFSTGRLDLIEQGEDGTLTWQLTGAPGYRYLIEKRVEDGDWQPFEIHDNPEGTLIFTDQPTAGADSVMYRSRILD